MKVHLKTMTHYGRHEVKCDPTDWQCAQKYQVDSPGKISQYSTVFDYWKIEVYHN